MTDGIGDGSFAWESPDTIPEVINDGFTVVFTPDDMENYLISEKTITPVVDRAIQSPLTISGIPDSLTFRDAPFHLTVQGGSGTGMISYAVTSGNALEIDSKGIVTIIHGGAATITVTKSGDDNYLALSHPISFTVNKAAQATALTYELPESVAYGDKPFAISGGGGDGSGTIDYFVTQGDALAVNKKGVVTILRPGEAVITLVKVDDLDYLSQTMALRLKVNQAVQDTLVKSGIPAVIRMGDAPFKLKVSGGDGIGALSYSVSSVNVISVNKTGLVSVLNEGTAYLTVTKAEDENYLAAMLTVEIDVDTAPVIEETPSISPTPSPKDTVVSKPEAAVEPKAEATDEPGPSTTDTTPPLSADTTSSQVSPPAYAKIDPVSIQTDEETDKIVIVIDLNDLSDGVTSIQMPSGEIIPLDTMRNSLELSINRSDINQAGELILVGLGQETIPIDRFTIDLSDDEQSDSSNNSVNVSLFLISLVTGLLILGGAMTAMIISSNKKK